MYSSFACLYIFVLFCFGLCACLLFFGFVFCICFFFLFLFFIYLECSDTDKCEAFTGKCHKEATCYNTCGSYVCTCKSGFIGDGHDCTRNRQ